MPTEFKRVVTAIDGAGKSVIQEDALCPAITAGLFPDTEIFSIWGTEAPLRSPVSRPAEATDPTFFPGPGGTRFGIFTFPPQQRDAAPAEAPEPEVLAGLVDEIEGKLPGLVGVFEPSAPGFHQTATIDYLVVVSGTLTLEVDDGQEAELPAGTAIVQNGTRHAWRNYGDTDAVLAFVTVAPE